MVFGLDKDGKLKNVKNEELKAEVAEVEVKQQPAPEQVEEETMPENEEEKQDGATYGITIRTGCHDYVIVMDSFEDALSGMKSLSEKALTDKLLDLGDHIILSRSIEGFSVIVVDPTKITPR